MKKALKTLRPSSRRLVRAARTRRMHMRAKKTRLIVYVSGQHTYAQIVAPDAKVLASASTAEKEMRQKFSNGGNMAAAKEVGARLAQKASALALDALAFDRGGRRYTGRVRALAEAARAEGLKF